LTEGEQYRITSDEYYRLKSEFYSINSAEEYYQFHRELNDLATEKNVNKCLLFHYDMLKLLLPVLA
jgi:hypothetical protein